MKEVKGSSQWGSVSGRDWTKGSVIRNLLLLSWPMMVHEMFWGVGTTVEMIWIGKLGATSVAGVGIAYTIYMLAITAKMGLTIGVRAMIARFVGAGDAEGANDVARHAFVITAVYTVVITAIGVLFAEPILSLFGVEPEVLAEGVAYMRVIFAGWVGLSFWTMVYGIMQASGDTVTPLKITVFLRFIHLLLAPFLIFGWWVFPRMGVSGAALSHVLAQTIGTSIAMWVLFTGRSRLQPTLRNFRFDPNILWRIVKIGIPASIMGVQRAIGNLALMWFMVPFGTLAVAAHSLALRVQMMLFPPTGALGMGAGVLVGQNLGAGQPERAERNGWLAAGLAQGFMVTCSVVMLLWAESIIGIFTTEPGLVEIGSTFLRIAVAGYLVWGFFLVLQQCISGAGDTLPVMLFNLVVVWVVQIPLAFLLPRVTDLGVYGVQWAIVAGLVVGAVASTVYFRLGRWKRKRV